MKVYMLEEVEDSLWQRFKARCLERRVTLRAGIIEAIAVWLNGKKA